MRNLRRMRIVQTALLLSIGVVRVGYGEIRRCEGRLGSGLGLVSSLDKMLKTFRRRSNFFMRCVAESSAAEAPCIFEQFLTITE